MKLIFDIGANSGHDADFYMKKGFKVVSVEADPYLSDRLKNRFAHEIATGQLCVENVGVSGQEATLVFYKNFLKDDWSSFDKSSKATRSAYEMIAVRTMPLSHFINHYGPSYYLKMDIEGFEKAALGTLFHVDKALLPRYLSFEANRDLLEILNVVHGIGYNRFQLVRQGEGHLQRPPKPALEGSYHQIKFTGYHSGCFGRELPGEWRGFKEIEATILVDIEADYQRAALAGSNAPWHDVHCFVGEM
ncbi:FkbM family methyltransferase [Synechococcus sp. BSF8S]|uniref:FkbM family methyltransferase n=1 Tax=Synechococcales TaxID=1890424 RepID=UPI001629B453|nr:MULTISPECIES: FkbM family methyltransferase [unclassified Synechococcus]MBC1261813.1 FkbM family methyltransferase [Synechococcus sp. BSF8S]MBC1264742.1 FkbM family methyltransferase [Synechococcus sp. BSA11S]